MIFGKPESKEHALSVLTSLQNSMHEVITSGHHWESITIVLLISKRLLQLQRCILECSPLMK